MKTMYFSEVNAAPQNKAIPSCVAAPSSHAYGQQQLAWGLKEAPLSPIEACVKGGQSYVCKPWVKDLICFVTSEQKMFASLTTGRQGKTPQ